MASLPLGSYGLSKVYNEYQKPPSQRLHHPAHCMSPIYNSNYFASTYQRDFYNNPVVENLSRRPSFSVGPGNTSIKQG